MHRNFCEWWRSLWEILGQDFRDTVVAMLQDLSSKLPIFFHNQGGSGLGIGVVLKFRQMAMNYHSVTYTAIHPSDVEYDQVVY